MGSGIPTWYTLPIQTMGSALYTEKICKILFAQSLMPAILFLPKIPSDIASFRDILFLRTGCIAPTTLNDFDVLISCAEEVLVVSGP